MKSDSPGRNQDSNGDDDVRDFKGDEERFRKNSRIFSSLDICGVT